MKKKLAFGDSFYGYHIGMIILFVIAIVGLIILCRANFWLTEKGIEQQYKRGIANKEMREGTEIIKIERHVFDYAVMEVSVPCLGPNCYHRKVCIDTNALFNYEFVDCD